MAEAGTDPDASNATFFADAAFSANPQPTYREMRSGCPVMRTDGPAGVILTRYEDVLFALRHPETFSSNMEAVEIGNQRPLIPLQLDPPEQTRYRRLLDPQFSSQKMRVLEPEVRRMVNGLIDSFIDNDECEFNEAFAIPLPCTVFLRLMGLPIKDLDLLLELKDRIIRPDTTDVAEATRIRSETGDRIYAYFEGAIDARRSERGSDLVSYLLDADVDGDRLQRTEILDICYLFLLGGLDTVTASLGCAVAYLARNPEQRRKLVADPSLIASAVEELLRWETPVMGIARVALQNVTIGDTEIRAGERVTLLIGSANTDEEEFADAEQVDVARMPNRHLAFGGGPHRCLGSHLARLELRVSLEELHRRIPDYAVSPGEEPGYAVGIREVKYLPLVFGSRLPAGEVR
ncbi:MAG: cytochrome P450 [Candidatus Binatia bacterium]